MEKIILKKMANGGLYLSGPDDTLPEGFMRRYRGISAFAKDSLISRDGSDLLYSLNAHSIRYFSGSWYSGVTTSLYRAAVQIVTGLSGDRLSFSAMAPTAGIVDYLFVAGGGDLFKVDSSGNDTDWGIDPPSYPGTVATDGGSGGELTDGAVYRYQFTFLNNTTGTRSNAAPDGEAMDSYTVLLLHGFGADASTTITDSSPSAHSPSAVGNCQIDTAQYRFGSSSILFDGTGDYVSVPDSADWNFGSGPYTIDFWMRPATSDDHHAICGQWVDVNNFFYVEVSNAGATSAFVVRLLSGGVTVYSVSMGVSADLPVDTWYHIEINRSSGGIFSVYIDGVLSGSASSSGAHVDLGAVFTVGYHSDEFSNARYFNGHIAELRVSKGIQRHTANFTPQTVPYAYGYIDLAGGSTSVDFTGIPESSDAQVDFVEIWRTQGDGTIFFKLADLIDGTTTYTDDAPDTALLSTELPTDNLKPYTWFDDCYGPWNASMFWITRSQSGERGRLYYSPIGRAEAVQGFIEITSDDDGLQKILGFAGNLFVLSKSRAFQIYGANPYYSREVSGVPGTVAPHTVAISPIGPIWESQDGVRLFYGGAQSKLLAYEQVKAIFRGRTVENVAAFTGVVATFARGEYLISDGTNTLALDIENLRWRDLGVGCNALAYSPGTDQIAATVSNTILDFEKEGEVDDNSVDIAYAIQTPSFDFGTPSFIERVWVEAEVNSETLAVSAITDGTAVSLGNLIVDNGRIWSEFGLDAKRRIVNRFGVRVAGSVGDSIELFTIKVAYNPIVLKLHINDTVQEIPGVFEVYRESLAFWDFGSSQSTIGTRNYVIERLFYDLNSNSNDVDITLYTMEGATIALTTLNNAARTQSEINIDRKGQFYLLDVSADFTKAIELRQIELWVRATNK